MGQKQDYDERFEKLVRALGHAIMTTQLANEKPGPEGVRVTEIRFKMDADNRTSVLVVAKGVRGLEELVAFTGGPCLEVAVLSLAGKLKGGSLHWREDRPWVPPA